MFLHNISNPPFYNNSIPAKWFIFVDDHAPLDVRKLSTLYILQYCNIILRGEDEEETSKVLINCVLPPPNHHPSPKMVGCLGCAHLMKFSKWPSIYPLAVIVGVDVCFPTSPENARDENIQLSVNYRLFSWHLSFWVLGTLVQWFLPLTRVWCQKSNSGT